MIEVQLTKVLEKRHISVHGLAQRMGKTDVEIWSLCRKEKDMKMIGLGTLNLLCNVLNCEPNDILKFTPDEDRYGSYNYCPVGRRVQLPKRRYYKENQSRT